MLGPLAIILTRIDKCLSLFRRPARLIEFERFQNTPYQTILIVSVKDLKCLSQAGFFPV